MGENGKIIKNLTWSIKKWSRDFLENLLLLYMIWIITKYMMAKFHNIMWSSFLVLKINKFTFKSRYPQKYTSDRQVSIRKSTLIHSSWNLKIFRRKYFPVDSLTYYTITQLIFVRISYHSFWKWIPQRTSSSEEKSDENSFQLWTQLYRGWQPK